MARFKGNEVFSIIVVRAGINDNVLSIVVVGGES